MRVYTSILSLNECSSFYHDTVKPLQLPGITVVLQRRTHLRWQLELKACVWTPGCSLQVTPGYDEACKSPGKGPGSPPPSEASGPGSAVTRTTDDSDSFSRARCYGSSHRRASGCDVPRPNALSSYGCCSGFFGPVGKRNKESVAAARSANTKLNFHFLVHRFNFKIIGFVY